MRGLGSTPDAAEVVPLGVARGVVRPEEEGKVLPLIDGAGTAPSMDFGVGAICIRSVPGDDGERIK